MRGRGNGGLTTITLITTTFAGPGVSGFSANRTSYLDDYDKIGPFLSFVGPNGALLSGAPPAPVTFIVDVPVPPIASVSEVSVTINGVQRAATKQGDRWRSIGT